MRWTPYVTRREQEEVRYLPTPIALLVLVVGVVLMLYAVLTFIGAVYVFVTGFIAIAKVLSETRTPLSGLLPFAIVAGAALITFGVAWFQYYIARKVMEGARWAWWFELFVTAPFIPVFLISADRLPYEVTVRMPPWWLWAALAPNVFITVVLLLALFSDALVRVSMGRSIRNRRRPT